jgi:thiosulfate/3-mercaptopyruvate sulfurtransferase
VTPGRLADQLGEVVVVDCRWTLGEPDAGRRAYEAGHIPGATHLDVDADLSAPPGDGRHPLPGAAAFAEACARAGIGARSRVVAYDEGHGGAARLWWLLRHFGHDGASVLDGEWRGPLETGGARVPSAAAPSFVPRARTDDVASADELARGGLDVVDARAPGRFRGEHEPIDPVAGHIPGAVNAPLTGNTDELGRFLPPDVLRRRFTELGVSGAVPVAAYCGSGVTACQTILALRLAGLDAALYPGSWSGWITDPSRPVATGTGPVGNPAASGRIT